MWTEHRQVAAVHRPIQQRVYEQPAQPGYAQQAQYPPSAGTSPGHAYGDQSFEGHL